MIYTDEMGVATGVVTTYTAMTGSPYSPLKNGKLLKVSLFLAGDAATSLIEKVTVKLTSPDWGVPVYVTAVGGGLRTATCPPIPQGDSVCDLPVTQATKITIEYKHDTGATPVTPRISVIGTFAA
jgi:hypothetical protein